MVEKIRSKISGTEKSGIINMLIKPISMIISLVYTPMLLAFLGDEKYGLWATLLSIINWINYFDVGIGNGLRNLLSKEIAAKEYDEAQKSVSTAYVVLSGISCVVLVGLIISVKLLDWNRILATSINMKPVLLISFTFICINFVLALSNMLFHAIQHSEKVSVRGCIVQAINLISLFLLSRFIDGSLTAIAILFGASTMVVYLYNMAYIFKTHRFLRPRVSLFDRAKIKQISNVGIKFFAIQIFCLMLFTVDNLLISHFFGADAVTPFSIANKVFYTAYTVLAAFLVPYWSRSAVAFSQNDYEWVKDSIKKVSVICALFICGYFALLIIFKPLVALWMRRELTFQPGLILVMCIFYSIYSILGVECQFINGSGKINTQLIIYAIIGIANIPFSILLGVQFGMGPVGIRLATTILISIEVIILAFDLLRIVNKLKQDYEIQRDRND